MLNAALIAALNHVLEQSPWARQRLMPFAGRHARLISPPWQFDWAVGATALFQEVAVTEGAEGDSPPPPDVTITLPSIAPWQLLNGLDPIMGQAHVAGHAEFATELSFILKNLRWDFEEDLSRVVGDIAAHRIAGGVTQFAAWQKQAAQNLLGNLAEYVSLENPLVLARADFADHAGHLAQVSARLEQIEQKMEQKVRSLG